MMTNLRRELMLKVSDEQPAILPVMHEFDRITWCDNALAWLVRNNLTGKAFLAFYTSCGNNTLDTLKEIRRRLLGERDVSPIRVGVDYKVF